MTILQMESPIVQMEAAGDSGRLDAAQGGTRR